MNKLVIVGNGFDLAHNYQTKYSDFVKWIWLNLKNNFEDPSFDRLLKVNSKLRSIYKKLKNSEDDVNSFITFKSLLSKIVEREGCLHDLENVSCNVEFENIFFQILSEEDPEANWSDIESLFYKILIEISQNQNQYYKDITHLNYDMTYIRTLFEKYLKEKIPNEEYNNPHFLGSILKYESENLKEGVRKNYLNEFPFDCYELLYEFDENLLKLEIGSQVDWLPQTLILDFNYTHTISNYLESITTSKFPFGIIEHIKIHGELNNNKNPINLGFGDEMDINYKELENKNDNKYLKFIKSFMYTNNSNYRKFLNWINANNFQVLILGHSCGLSDRILLNTIFEHENCKSIKVFYYQYESEGKINDDFTERIQNISRHFNDKKLMRSKLVDKQLCKPLII